MIGFLKRMCNNCSRLMTISLPFKVFYLALIAAIFISSILDFIYYLIGCEFFPFPISCRTSVHNNPHYCRQSGNYYCCG